MNARRFKNLLDQGLALHQAGHYAEAEAVYAPLRREGPKDFDVQHLSGLVAIHESRFADAVGFLQAAQKLDRRSAGCAVLLGFALRKLNRLTAAEETLRRATKLDPAVADAWAELGFVLQETGKLSEALAALEQAVALDPGCITAHARLGFLKSKIAGYAAAEPHFRQLVAIQPASAKHWANLGICRVQQMDLGEALECFDQALARDPDLGLAHAGRGLTLDRCLRVGDALRDYAEAVRLDPADFDSHSNRLFCSQQLGAHSQAELFRLALDFGRVAETVAASARSPAAAIADADPERRLRVAFLSPDFRRHSVAFFIEPLLAHLDRRQFEIFLYHDHFDLDEVSGRLSGLADAWHHVAGLPNDALHAQIAAAPPDILVDLSGHTSPNRLPLLARRLAPVQVTYLGYPGTTGLSVMDYRFVDAVSDPAGEGDHYHTEQLVRFAPTAWAYLPSGDAPAVAPPPCATGRPVPGGCFNKYAKVTDGILGQWARILTAVPGSRLMLKARGLENPVLLAHAKQRFAAAGLDPARVMFRGRTPDGRSHLATYDEIDVALDTFPYNGTTTTCEALWQGVPVVTLTGDTHASRVGTSLLAAAQHPEWVACDWGDYVRKAVGLVAQPARLEATRSALRGELHRSALLDHATHAARFGHALRETWRHACATTPKMERAGDNARQLALRPSAAVAG